MQPIYPLWIIYNFRSEREQSDDHRLIIYETLSLNRCYLNVVCRQELKTGSTMHFLMAVPECLGLLQYFRVWHDTIGDSTSWYLNRIEVTDLQTDYK